MEELSVEGKIRLAAMRAHLEFVANDWTWGLDRFTPTVEQIENTYRELIDMAHRSGSAETGRLIVRETDLGTQLAIELETIHPLDSTESPEGH